MFYKKCKQDDKPGYVVRDHLSLIPMLPPAFSDQPEAGGPRTLRYGLASNGVYIASFVTKEAVVSYTCLSTLTAKCGGLFLLH